MYTVDITTSDGKKTMEIPAGWDDISYEYYKEKIEPFASNEGNIMKNNVRLVCSMLDIETSQANIMEFSAILEGLLSWLEEVPEIKSFIYQGQEYTLPVLGKSQAGEQPFLSVADWENANDALQFLEASEFSKDSTADQSLVLLCALARGKNEVNDVEFARRLTEWQDLKMDVLLSASFFFLQFTHIFETDTLPFLTAHLKRVHNTHLNISLDGLRLLRELQPQAYLQNLLNEVV